MKTLYKIGGNDLSDNKLFNINQAKPIAEITYERGSWILKNLDSDEKLLLNDRELVEPQALKKYDVIKIGSKKNYWSDYLYEGDKQELVLVDILHFHGRLSRANFRALSILLLGIGICLFFLPGLWVAYYRYLNRNRLQSIDFDPYEMIQNISPYIYGIGYLILLIVLFILVIKRMRDAKEPIWKLGIPVYNLKILYFDISKF
ncbi:MAG: FHA domain-containing protein [Saprospiraceae bacterium]|nr:FHA domain-containing protein [Saprospiraceae bacterium]